MADSILRKLGLTGAEPMTIHVRQHQLWKLCLPGTIIEITFALTKINKKKIIKKVKNRQRKRVRSRDLGLGLQMVSNPKPIRHEIAHDFLFFKFAMQEA